MHVTFQEHCYENRLKRKGFVKLIGALCPGRTLSESDIGAWWRQLIATPVKGEHEAPLISRGASQSLSGEAPAEAPRDLLQSFGQDVLERVASEKDMRRHRDGTAKAHCTFERFATWYAQSELRSGYT